MIWTTSICLFEIRMGIEILPDGARKEYIRRSFERILEEKLSHRVFDLGTAAAESAARIMGDLRRRGFGIDIRDLLIAGVVAERKASLATRNIKHFAEVGIDLINPWDERRRAS
jgi:predicted nucleic acid-binding protein